MCLASPVGKGYRGMVPKMGRGIASGSCLEVCGSRRRCGMQARCLVARKGRLGVQQGPAGSCKSGIVRTCPQTAAGVSGTSLQIAALSPGLRHSSP